jgi:hypothetical protein
MTPVNEVGGTGWLGSLARDNLCEFSAIMPARPSGGSALDGPISDCAPPLGAEDSGMVCKGLC